MTTSRVLDTVGEFASLWKRVRRLPVSVQVDEWAQLYGQRWPELLRRQKETYSSRGVSWRRVAETKVFPGLPARWARIRVAHATLRSVIPAVDRRVRDRLRFRRPLTHLLHVGIGCGAGWASTYDGTPAIFYGLENVAELGWTGRDRLEALVAHELAHVIHSDLRERAGQGGLESVHGPYGQLYSEGFATRVEQWVIGPSHSSGSERDVGWSAWCRGHEQQLAAQFLRTVHRHRSARRFFGSWYRNGGHVETGYWLGAEVVRSWESTLGLDEIATLPAPSIRERCKDALRRLASL